MKKDFSNELELFNRATEAAQAAAKALIAANPGEWYPCGFASVKISPARGRFVQFLKENEIGYTDTYAGGYVVNDPARLFTQWMDAKLAGASAFAKVLKEAGVNARAESMVD